MSGSERTHLEDLGDWRRSHTCGELRKSHAGGSATLMGWVHRTRDHGGVLFVDLRDRHGITQIVFHPETGGRELLERGERLGNEWVIAVRGPVTVRPAESVNDELATGDIELDVRELKVLAASAPLPFQVNEEMHLANEDLRLKHRYLDLRRPELSSVLVLRHRAAQAARAYLSGQNFLEIETPMLVRPTPEGARDYVVPSRLHPGKFYALPQSPQLYKQILMVSGFDRYFQIARCLRDEDLRADRQPEFTQIDLEMSFVSEDDVFEVVEGMMASIFRRDLGRELKVPFPRLTYRESMERYGSDKPDLRIPFEIRDVTDAAGESAMEHFQKAKAGAPGTMVGALAVPGLAGASRKEIDGWEAAAKLMGAGGLAWARVKGGALDGGMAKHFQDGVTAKLLAASRAEEGSLLLVASGPRATVLRALGHVRTQIGAAKYSLDPKEFRFVWVHQFPLFEWIEERKAWAPAHHIFTMPLDEHLAHLQSDPGSVHAQLYDLAANGHELASGSIRIHRKDIQERVMGVIGMSREEAMTKFGFLLEAFEYGAPPHGGIALGLDRMVVLFQGGDSIRDAIAFPKTARASSLMDEAPGPIDEADLRELHLRVTSSTKP